MMRYRILFLLAAFALAAASGASAQSRAELPEFLLNPEYRSSRTNEKKAVHDGNRVAITFFNYGLFGGTGEVRGNWPKGSDDFYVGDVLPIVVAEVPIDLDGDNVPDTLVHHAVTTRGPRNGANGPAGDGTTFWGFEAKPGFAAGGENAKPALSTDPATWPARWPDQTRWIDPETGRAAWNGYFGRGVKNADLESYFWMDDHNDLEIQSPRGFGFDQFAADSTDRSRGGLGLEVKVRGMQWSQFLAQDVLFILYEVTNSSTTTYPRVATGLTVGTLAGGDNDSNDDLAFFDQANRFVYSWDFDDSGNRNQDVGYVGYGFLESPGDARNGIDDDGDGDPTTELGRDMEGWPYVPAGRAGEGNVFQPQDFQPRVLQAGEPVILIDAATGRRSIAYLPEDGSPLTVVSQGVTYTLEPGLELAEKKTTVKGQIDQITITERNLVDEDLDGLIDEDLNLHFIRRQQAFSGQVVTLPALRYTNYLGFARDVAGREATTADSLRHGLLNPMIDEDRADGRDNDGDWDPVLDDVGADGVAGTADAGEGDGRPTAGEPNFDALDVDESDQVGLSSFYYFTPPDALPMNDDALLWRALSPGFFTTNRELQMQQAGGGVDGDFIFGSGYFRLEPGQTLRFSMALVFGEDLEDITNNVKTAQEIYDRNYNFARPPERPTLHAVPGDGRVTLYWDAAAEASTDPVLGQDFEGYRLYRSTDPFFRDPEEVTDGLGAPSMLVPLRQFDLANGRQGVWPADLQVDFTGAVTAQDSLRILDEYRRRVEASETLQERTRGVPFYLGGDTGLRHAFVDTTVQNGRAYYYALTAYDHGSAEFYPAENNFAVSVAEDGTVVTGKNVVEVRPNAPVAGFVAGGPEATALTHAAGAATGDVFLEVLNPSMLTEGTAYDVTFTGEGLTADAFTVRADGVVVVDRAPLAEDEATLFDGMRLRFRNDATRVDTDATGYADTTATRVDLYTGPIDINERRWQFQGTALPYDYEVRFSDQVTGRAVGGVQLGTGRDAPLSKAVDTYFTVVNTTTGEAVPFAFDEISGTPNGRFDGYEFIFLFEEGADETLVPTYLVRPALRPPGGAYAEPFPQAGDVFQLKTYKDFSTGDRYTFRTRASGIDEDAARAQLDRVKVVPNPYLGAAAWERETAQTVSGRGERRVDFTHIPQGATITVYNVRGELVRELVHDGGLDDGTVGWDLKTREGLEVAYGVYFYHVRAPGLGETTGKLAIIK